MKDKQRRWYAPASVFAILLVAIGCIVIWETTESRSILARSQEQQTTRQSMSSGEDSKLRQLTSLLSRNGLSVQESALLPARVENSYTVLVRFESTENTPQGNGLQAVMPQEFSLSRLEVKPNTGGLTRQRSLELSPSLVMVVAINRDKQLLWWSLLPDPRLLRAETSDGNASLSGQIIYRSTSDMLVAYPANKSITELRFYHPSWDGQEYKLEFIGNLDVPPME